MSCQCSCEKVRLCNIHVTTLTFANATDVIGAIIPQIEPRACVPDRTQGASDILYDEKRPNPVTFHIYPGRDNSYDMFLDDGVSRNSAPDNAYLSSIPDPDRNDSLIRKLNHAFGDQEAAGRFRQVRVEQVTSNPQAGQVQRTVTISTIHSLYTKQEVKRDIGPYYTVVFWHAPEDNLIGVDAKVTGADKAATELRTDLRATVVTMVPTDVDDRNAGVTIVVSHST